MEIGAKIKYLRQQLNLSQSELADRCELTKGYISQLENDLTSPSIATLIDILSALGTDLSEFFKTDDEKIVFGSSDYSVKQEDGMLLKWLIPTARKNGMEPVLVELLPNAAATDFFQYDGDRLGYVLEGKICITLDNRKHLCKRGETFYYESSRLHEIVNVGNNVARFLWVSTAYNS